MSEKSEKSEKVVPSTGSTKIKVEKYVNTLSDYAPKQFQPQIQKAAPFIGQAVQKLEELIPVIHAYYLKALELWKKLEPYKPDLLIPSFIGLIMCFFGGSFLTLIAAVEAYRICGYETTLNCINTLISDFEKVVQANKKDDEVDDDNDGVPDVLQVSNKELAKRKVILFLKTVDPKRVTDALGGIHAGLLAVVATLKLEFAKTITLGHSIATTVEEPVHKYLLPYVIKLVPAEYHKWAKVVISYTIKSIAISIAWSLQRLVSSFHSAIRGGLMCSRNILVYCSKMGYANINHEDTYIDEIVGFALAIAGLFFQLRFGFGLPFPLNILLFPFSIAEYLLIWLIAGK